MSDKFFDAGVPVPWPHGSYDGTVARCPDGLACEQETEWGHACGRDIGEGYMCLRMQPPGGWNDPDLPLVAKVCSSCGQVLPIRADGLCTECWWTQNS